MDEEGFIFLVTEHADLDLHRDRSTRPAPEASRLVGGLAAGLGAAHRVGLVHGYLHPKNVFTATPRGSEHLLVGDFGLRGLESSKAEAPGDDAGGSALFSFDGIGDEIDPYYQAPESLADGTCTPASRAAPLDTDLRG